MLIDLVQLRTFVAVAEERHLTRAAERLYISQSAASAHVRAVEERLDTQLFVRTNRSLELTSAGQLLLSKARVLLNEATQFASFARELRGKVDGTLIVGTSSERDAHIGDIIGALHNEHPLVMVDLRARTSMSARQGLRNGELDVSILLGEPQDLGFTYHELTKVHFCVAGPAAWRDRIERAGWTDLARMPWIVPNSSTTAYSGMFAALFAQHSLEINTVGYFDNPALGQEMLRAGVGLMLLRTEHANRGVEDGTMAVSPIAKAECPLLIAYQTSRQGDPLIQAFAAATQAVWRGMRLTHPPANGKD